MGSQEDFLSTAQRSLPRRGVVDRRGFRRRGLASAFLAATLVLVAVAAGTSIPAEPANGSLRDFNDQVSYRVNRVIDGDTLELVMAGREVKVRLVGIDTPERERAGRAAEPYAHEATSILRRLCENGAVYLEYDPLCARKDRYGRTLGHLFRAPDGLWLNREMVRLGMSPVYDKYPFSFLEEFQVAEREARVAGAGIWSAQSTPPASSAVRGNAASQLMYVTAKGRAYHRSDCHSLRGMATAITLEEAQRRGLKDCENCRPRDR